MNKIFLFALFLIITTLIGQNDNKEKFHFEFVDLRNLLPMGKSQTAALLLWMQQNSWELFSISRNRPGDVHRFDEGFGSFGSFELYL